MPGQDTDAPAGTSQQPVATLTVQLPPFSTNDALAWFQRAEILFRTKRITATTKKADLVLAALPEDIFPQISTWLLAKEDTDINYEETKEKLLELFTPTPEERAEKLLMLSRLPLASQRPSTAFEEMRALATLPDKRSVDLLRVLWLLRLPDNVREALVDFMNTDINELKKHADAKIAATRQSRTTAPALDHPTEDEEDVEQPAAAASKPFQQQQPQQRRRPRQLTSQQTLPDICWYHENFGSKAVKCRAPCRFSKNE